MNQILSGGASIVIGIILLLLHKRSSNAQKQNEALEKPYIKNAGLGFLLFGTYYLLTYFFSKK